MKICRHLQKLSVCIFWQTKDKNKNKLFHLSVGVVKEGKEQGQALTFQRPDILKL